MKLTFLPSTRFRADLDRRVDDYFSTTGLPRRGVPGMLRKSLILLAWFWGTWAVLLVAADAWWQAILLGTSLGMAMAGIGFNIMHDAGHGAYSRHRGINGLMEFALDMIGGSSYFWRFKHNVAHHTYPNLSGYDDDIFVGVIGRLSPHDQHRRFHRFQHLYMWVLYCLLAIRWHLIDDFHSLLDPGIARTCVPRPRGADLLRFCLGKLCFFGAFFILPMLLHPVWVVLVVYAIAAMTLGLIMATVFQLAHCVEEARFPAPPPEGGMLDREWAVHQVDTTVDFGRDSSVLTWYVGGLNFQVEHHLFPKVCHLHYPALAPIVEEVCAAHGIKYHAHPSARLALRSHYRFLRQMGLP